MIQTVVSSSFVVRTEDGSWQAWWKDLSPNGGVIKETTIGQATTRGHVPSWDPDWSTVGYVTARLRLPVCVGAEGRKTALWK